jgi:hypothetical protein
MPRPKNKEELIELSEKNFKRLNDYLDQLSSKELNKEFPKGYLNRSIRDVIAHLHHWNLMVLDWYKVGLTGEKPDIPTKGYTWKTLPDLNKEIQNMYVTMTLEEARSHFISSFDHIRELIKNRSNEELFEKKRYNWTGSTSLGAYLISVSSSHFDWAYKLIKKCLK